MYVDMSEPLAAEMAPGILTIDLSALARNYHALATRLAPVLAGAVVKADAYGLGATRVAPALHAAGCRTFFVAHLGEAVKLRRLLPEDSRLFVLNGLQPGAEGLCADAGIIPVLNSLEQVANWAATAAAQGRNLPAALQFDTGMSRLGLSDSEAQALTADPSRLRGIDIAFVMSHLASADERDNPQNASQLAAMGRFAVAYPGVEVCFSNSGGIFLDAGYHAALARPGIALYGGTPMGGFANPMEPVVRLDVRVTQTRTVPAGARVGYGGTYVTKAETRLATLAAGYADGLPRHLSDRGAAYFGDTRLPIVGRVSMDAMTLDVSALPEGTLKLGSLVEIIGPHQTLEDVAAAAGTIAYEILTSLGHRYHRAYR